MLALAQWGVERTALAGALTEALARGLTFLLTVGLRTPARLDGLVLEAAGMRLPVTVSCLGLIVITGYLSALVATPTSWVARWRGTWQGVPLLVLANLGRLGVLGIAIAVWPASFAVAHALLAGVAAPLAVLALWGLWLWRYAGALPAIPWRFAERAAAALVPAAVLWWVLLTPYLHAVLALTVAMLNGLGVGVEHAALVTAGFAPSLELAIPEGVARLQATSRSLSLVPFVALMAASPVPWRRRLGLGLTGVALGLLGHGLESALLVLLGRSAAWLVSPAEAMSDFLTLAQGPILWALLLAPSPTWWDRQGTRTRPGRGARGIPGKGLR